MRGPCSLPAGWAVENLGALGTWSGGGTPSKANKDFWTNGTVPWVSPKDMKFGRIRTAQDAITKEAVAQSAAKIIPENSVLMVTRSGILAHTFPVAVSDCTVTINQDLKALTPLCNVDANYLAWYLSAQNTRILTECAKHGTTVASIDTDRLKKFSVPIAPLGEQGRIVEKLETLFARLDKGEEALREVQKLLARYRQSVLKAAVTGQLTADWRAENAHRLEHARDLLARILKTRRETWTGRGKYKEPAAPDTSDLPELPNGWVWTTLSQLTKIKGGVTVDKKREAHDPVTLPYLRVANVQHGYLDLNKVKEITVDRDKAAQCLLKTGDILLNEGGDRDKLGRGWVWDDQISPCIHQNHVFRARPILSELSSKFVSYYSNAFGQTFFMQKGKQSVNLASISQTAISDLPIPLPSSEEQHEIVTALEGKLAIVATMANWCETELARSANLRQSMLKDAFAGRLVPQDPADEPAADLLARIRAENARRSTPNQPGKNGRTKRRDDALVLP